MVVRIQDWLRAHEQDLVNDLIPILQIPSVEGDPLPNAPFGQANRDALDRVLAMGDAWGMKTKDLDGYVGYAEFGTGAKLITVLAHLDVVPVGPGWKHEPFGAHIDDGYLYARGAPGHRGILRGQGPDGMRTRTRRARSLRVRMQRRIRLPLPQILR